MSPRSGAAWLALTLIGGLAYPHVALGEPAAVAAVSPLSAAAVREEDLLLFAVDLDSLTISESLAAYGAPDDPLLPLGELARLLDMDIDVSPGERRVTGRLGEAQRAVIIDLATNTARVGGKAVALTVEDWAVSPTEIYFRASALQRLLPITFAIDSEALQIKITALEILPIQARLQRMANARDNRTEIDNSEPVYKVASPYELFSPPAFDVGLQSGVDALSSGTARRYDVRLAGDVLYTGFQGYVGSDERGEVSNVRATFERRSLDGGLLGPINATSAAAGDVFTPGMAIGPRSIGGRGFVFSTAPLEQASVFDRIDLRGELPLGYDVELYVNDILRSGQRSPVQGRYEFLAVPLVRGVNIIRIVSYGPRGERSEHTRVVNVSGGQMMARQATFEFGVVQQEDSLVPVRPRGPILATSGAGQVRAVANLNYGLTSNLTMVAGLALHPVKRDDSRQVFSVGARTSVLGFATQVDAAGDDSGGAGLGFGLAGQKFGASVVARHAEYRGGFVDEGAPSAGLLLNPVRHSEISVDGALDLGRDLIPLSTLVQRDQFNDGSSAVVATVRGSGTVANLLLSSGFDYQRITNKDFGSRNTLTGTLSASKFANYKWQLRGALDYSLAPRLKLGAIALTADRDIAEKLAIRFGIGQSLSGQKNTSLQAGAIYRTRYGDLSLSGDYSTPRNDWSLNLQFAFGLVFDPGTRRYGMTRPGPASGGSVAFRAFVDRDADGKFGPGDEPAPKVTLDGGERQALTGADGRVLATGFGAGPISRIQVGLDGVDNPFVSTPPSTVQFSPRPGHVTQIAYPMVPTGEVMALVRVRKADGKLMGVSAVRVRVVRDGAPPVEAVTEFDGSVNFVNLPVGVYRFELDPTQAARLRMRLASPASFTVFADGGFVRDLNTEVVFDPAPGQKVASPAAEP